jgi:hypothetical protein
MSTSQTSTRVGRFNQVQLDPKILSSKDHTDDIFGQCGELVCASQEDRTMTMTTRVRGCYPFQFQEVNAT